MLQVLKNNLIVIMSTTIYKTDDKEQSMLEKVNLVKYKNKKESV